MRKRYSFVVGSMKIEIIGRKPERILNICTEQGISFRGAKRISENAICLNIAHADRKAVERIASQAGLAVNVLSEHGIPIIIRRFKKRYVLYFMPALSIFAAIYFSFFIWELEITGNETVSASEILSALETAGVTTGVFGPGIDQEIIRNKVLLEIPKLSWMTVNVYGCRAEVIVRERTDKPEILNEKEPAEVRAAKAGLITKINVFIGKPLVKTGDTVMLGETLISGVLESKSSGTRYVHSSGEIFARTWYEISAKIPLEYQTKSYTGRTVTKHALLLGAQRLNLYLTPDHPFEYYDKTYEEERFNISGFLLPLSMIKSQYREYVPDTEILGRVEAEAILKNRLQSTLKEMIGDTEPVSTLYDVVEDNGILTLTLHAECNEQIGIATPISPA